MNYYLLCGVISILGYKFINRKRSEIIKIHSYNKNEIILSILSGDTERKYFNCWSEVIKEIPYIQILNCHDTRITEIPNIKGLKELYCYNTNITEIPNIKGLQNLTCHYTNITKIPNIKGLKVLSCSETNIT